MAKKNLLSGRDKELLEMAEAYEQSQAEGKSIYMDAEDMADLADWYALRHKPNQAQEVVTYGLSIHPANTSLLVQQAYLYVENDEIEKAQEVVESIEEETTEAIILNASLRLIMDKPQEAKAILEKIDKDDVANIVEVAYMYIDEGYFDDAEQWITRGKNKYKNDSAYLSVCAEYHYAQHQWDKAIEYYNRLIDENPYSPFYWQGIARCYFEQGTLDKAIEACDYATLSDEEFADAYLLRASAFYELGNTEKALENYKQAERLQVVTPGFISLFQGMDKVARKEWQEAYRFLQESIEKSSKQDRTNLCMALSNAGLCLYKLGEKEEACNEWNKVHQTYPDDSLSYLIEGRTYMEGQETDKAIACWEKATAIAPYPETWDEIGMYCLNAGQAEYACRAFEIVKEMNPTYTFIYEKLSVAYLIAGNKDKFKEYNLLSSYPVNPQKFEDFYEQLKSIDKEDMMQIVNKLLNSLE